ncbi:pyridoxine 5'-phosphate synthase [Candidatus Tachikawaea gelatinosa]|uniref:Pyridoxine 5'-phosphate synthase n=1 Tax=Candidatus Tachikawaea gelatinosa TaxID=1410383 RepID=A0A090AQL0_9ENTR|nr:pyridoxine 5'-phosphate synthase [Candidatus Tachikawaea gelatinosa]BAP58632.1 pyridoxine 5'-phosphate synthase [Candidatus Tachikawaea gelatinosa]
MQNLLLGVNIDHVATLRNARKTSYPDPIQAAYIVEQAGADSITLHLREDERHISQRDVFLLRDTIQTKMNLELSLNERILNIAYQVKPDFCCLVPEKRNELTTEGGLNILIHKKRIISAIKEFNKLNIKTSLFIEPTFEQIEAAVSVGASIIELHTGSYAQKIIQKKEIKELKKLQDMAIYAKKLGLVVNAGHGLDYHNVCAIAKIKEINELNIGHSIISRAIFHGLHNAVKDMKYLMKEARNT